MNSLRKLWRRLRGEEVHTSPFLVQPMGQQTESMMREPQQYPGPSTPYRSSSTYCHTGLVGSSILTCSSYISLPTVTTPAPEPPPAPKTFRAPIAGVESKRSILRDE